MVGQREGDGDDGRVMEQDLVEGSVATAAAAALTSAATKAKVKPSFHCLSCVSLSSVWQRSVPAHMANVCVLLLAQFEFIFIYAHLLSLSLLHCFLL